MLASTVLATRTWKLPLAASMWALAPSEGLRKSPTVTPVESARAKGMSTTLLSRSMVMEPSTLRMVPLTRFAAVTSWVAMWPETNTLCQSQSPLDVLLSAMRIEPPMRLMTLVGLLSSALS